MNVLYYDCFAGISGDMNLGALIDLGIDENYLRNELTKLNLPGYDLLVERKKKMGIEGTLVTVKLTVNQSHHHHERSHGHHHEKHRNLHDIYQIIDNSTLGKPVKERAKKMFLLIGEAEAKIHGKPLEEIHFHEVGAIDSIVDIVGSAICLEKLNVDRTLSSPVQVGGGFVKCAHGTFPVPAPATAEILKNIPIKKGGTDKEMTTPTGAAILAANVDEFMNNPEFTVQKIGYGLGHRDLNIPNTLRVFIGEMEIIKNVQQSIITECNIDDMNPEYYDHIMDILFQAGAADVFFTPIQMKKNRPSIKLSVLHGEEQIQAMDKILLEQTSTFGLRRYRVQKIELDRNTETMEYNGYKVRIKTGFINDQIVKAKPEYEDCKKISKELNIPISEVSRDVQVQIVKTYFNH